MDRRAFLSTAAATPFIFGLSDLFSQDAPSRPAWMKDALKRMKATGRYGILVVTPTEENDRKAMGLQLLAIVEGKDYASRELLFEAVILCVPAEMAKPFQARGEDHNRILLDPDGKRVTSDTIKIDVFAKPETFSKSFRSFLHGPSEKNLVAAVNRLKNGLSDESRKKISSALEDLDTEGLAPESSTESLKLVADKIAPWLVFARMDAIFENGRTRVQGVIQSRFETRLPYGTKIHQEPFRDSCPACGMVRVEPAANRFLKFLQG